MHFTSYEYELIPEFSIGGDLSLVAVLCIMSGILGVLIGPQMLVWLRIPEGMWDPQTSLHCICKESPQC